jgi:hypothetical protein
MEGGETNGGRCKPAAVPFCEARRGRRSTRMNADQIPAGRSRILHLLLRWMEKQMFSARDR